ncbi:MAG: trimethylamine methyltransferase family protein [Bacillota bacterium]
MNSDLMTRDLEELHAASMKILEEVGVQFHHPEVLEIIRKKGILVKEQTAFFTQEQIMEWIDKAPKNFNLYARNPRYDMHIGGERVEYAPGYGAPTVSEIDGTKRPALLSDYIKFLKLSHQCEFFNCNGGVLVQPKDINVLEAGPLMTYATILFSDKCLIGVPSGIGPDGHEMIMEMLGIVFDGKEQLIEKPRIIAIANTTSPLMFDKLTLDIMLTYGKYGQPVMISPATMAGTTGPVTLAGTIALANAEVLAGVAVMQMIRNETPVVYGWQTTSADMKSGAIAMGSAERTLIISFGARLAKLYELPVRGGGTDTDAKCVSVQSGYESMMTLFVTAREKMNLVIHSAGILDGFNSMSYEQFMVDLEIIAMVERFNRGVEINAETLALDVIKQVGPSGEYLTQEHTCRFCRTEHFSPDISFRGYIEGKPHDIIFNRIRNKIDKMLSNYHRPELPPSIRQRLFDYLVSRGIDQTKLMEIEKEA